MSLLNELLHINTHIEVFNAYKGLKETYHIVNVSHQNSSSSNNKDIRSTIRSEKRQVRVKG